MKVKCGINVLCYVKVHFSFLFLFVWIKVILLLHNNNHIINGFVVLGGVGIPHLREGEVAPQGGKPGWAAPPSPRIGPWLKLLKRIAESRGLVPEFEVYLRFNH